MSGDNVQVAVRVRPFNAREKQRNANLIIAMDGTFCFPVRLAPSTV